MAKINAAGSSLAYSTYLGGNCTDYATAVAVDSSGNAYVAGDTGSTDFPTMNAFQPAYHGGSQPGCCDAFVTKLNPAGNALVYSTYLGGRQAEHASGIAADASGNAYVAGWTGSYDFPVANAIQPNCQNCNPDNGGANAFVTKFDATGSALMYSTFLGDDSSAAGLAVDSSGNAYVGGVGLSDEQ